MSGAFISLYIHEQFAMILFCHWAQITPPMSQKTFLNKTDWSVNENYNELVTYPRCTGVHSYVLDHFKQPSSNFKG